MLDLIGSGGGGLMELGAGAGADDSINTVETEQ